MATLHFLRLTVGASVGALWAAPCFVACAEGSSGSSSSQGGSSLGGNSTVKRNHVEQSFSSFLSPNGELQRIAFNSDNTPPNLISIMDRKKDLPPVKMVVVGGGHAASRFAYQMDSIADMTLVSDKNYYLQANDVIPIIAREWTQTTDDMLAIVSSIHRFYLKRTNVLTGTAESCTTKQVTLKDGRTLKYDLLFVALGEEKPFPFGSKQATLAGRIQELKYFNAYLKTKKNVAIVGGGPMGVSLAGVLAEARPDMQIELFQSQNTLVPGLPILCQDYSAAELAKRDNVKVHLSTRVVAINERFASPDGSAAASTPGASSSGGGFWSRLFGRGGGFGGAANPLAAAGPLPDTYDLSVDVLEHRERTRRSMLHHLYFGPDYQTSSPQTAVSRQEIAGFDHVFSLVGDTPREVPKGFLQDHLSSDGHLRVSVYNQIFEHPNVFGVGRCSNLPVLRSQSFSDVQAKGTFRALIAVIMTPQMERYFKPTDSIRLQHYIIPRIVCKLGVMDAFGCNSWGGSMVGTPALMEYTAEKMYLQKDFTQPTFFKPQLPSKVRQKLATWMENELTDVCDFTF